LKRKFAAGTVAAAVLALAAPAAHAQSGPPLGSDGTTAPTYSYQDAKRERVFIPVAGVDQDNNGVTDRVAIDIIRPKESGPNLKVPAIIDDSPYYTSVGRGNETQYIHTTANGTLDKFPLFYDNYFVPRGYAVILAQSVGTAFSTGCPLHGGPGDVAGFKAVIDWTEGRVPGYTSVDGTTPVLADWSNGKNAMIGKSYDGTFANGVAATGVDGLTTIVPISAISDWYDYSRMGGVRENTHYPRSLDTSITATQSAATLGVLPPDHRAPCANVFTGLDSVDGDVDGDINPFWQDRNYAKDVAKVKAAVFESHGINDDNVRPDQMYRWWTGLAANNVPRKLWLSQEGHVDPFDYRRGAWVDTLHRWFDYWLQGVNNGIMSEPRVDIEQPQGDVWKTYTDWPLPGTTDTSIFLGGKGAGASGTLSTTSGGSTDSLSFVDANLPETPPRNNPTAQTSISTPTGSQANRLVFLSPKLTQDLHVSGTPTIDLQASLSTAQSNLGALIVDYGASTRVGRGGADGVTNATTRTCAGDNSTDTSGNVLDSACYLEVTKPAQSVTSWRVSKGILDSSNRDSLFTGQSAPAVPGTKYEFKFQTLPTDYTFPAGHQIGIVIVANYSSFSSVNGTTGATVTVDTKNSKVLLPVTGGTTAADAAGVTPDTTAPALAVSAPATVNSTDSTGTTVSYTATATDTQDSAPTVSCTPGSGTKFAVGTTHVTCTATDANGNATTKAFDVVVQFVNQQDGGAGGSVPATLALTLGTPATFGAFTPGVDKTYDASTTATVISTAGDAMLTTDGGKLSNGAFSLAEPLQIGFSKSTWTGPTSNESVTIGFKQHIGANEPLRTGSYAKTLTFTLSTTTP
jgi:X-Pro dipeptidyl-peptidase